MEPQNDSPDDGWVEDFVNSPYVPKHKPKRSGQTPHALLKHKCRAALTAWRQQHGISVVLLPSIVGRIKTMQGREIAVGKKGQADDTLALLGTCLAIEYKAGADRQSEHQVRFQERWIATGNPYVVVRKPSDLTDALTQIAAQKGYVF